MKPLIDVARESFLILDPNLRVICANPIFYKNFQVSALETENMFIYKLGNGQWDILKLRILLEKILPDKKNVKDYEVEHIFPKIGKKTILLNARQIDSTQLIVLAMEDITVRKDLEKKLAEHASDLEFKIIEKTTELVNKIAELESINKSMVGRELKMVEMKKEIKELKKIIEIHNNTI